MYTIVSLVGITVLLGIISLVRLKRQILIRKLFILLFSISFLFIYSTELAVFYLLYSICNYVLFVGILKASSQKKVVFVSSIILNIFMLMLLRILDIGIITHAFFAPVILLGLVYTLLKVINTFYYAYFVGDDESYSFSNYLCYLLFIPTFTSGPIIKFLEFNHDMNKNYQLTSSIVETSTKRIIKGLFKKLVLVSFLFSIYNSLLSGDLNTLTTITLLFCFYILLYLDFSGYTDISIGFGNLMGIRVPENFKRPFSSPTLTQFWRNWHATLGDWFRDHVFSHISKKSKSRYYGGFISLLIMLLVGVWHGVNTLFILWGFYHGILLFIENVLKQSMVIKRRVSPIYFWSRVALTNVLVAVGTIFFSADVDTAMKIVRGLFSL